MSKRWVSFCKIHKHVAACILWPNRCVLEVVGERDVDPCWACEGRGSSVHTFGPNCSVEPSR